MPRTDAHPPAAKDPATPGDHRSDLQAATRLVIDAVLGITNVVEAMHRNIASVAPVVGQSRGERTRGITGLVYASVRGITRTVGFGLDTVLANVAPLLPTVETGARREAAQAALNGIFGDHLAATHNPLAIPLEFCHAGSAIAIDGPALAARFTNASPHVMVLVHGLCMNDRQWQRAGHDHGAALSAALGCTAIYLRYNTGRNVEANGREFAERLEALMAAWPVPVRTLTLIGHSMGGLVARSAIHSAEQNEHRWRRTLAHLICLGTPHHGAQLERAGAWVDRLLGISPYSAPLARLGAKRSAGIKDLRYGRVVDAEGIQPGRKRGIVAIPLPTNVHCFAVAASLSAAAAAPSGRARGLRGDGLVTVRSAWGEHQDPARHLAFPAHHKQLCLATDHFDLLSSHAVFAQLLTWLAPKVSA
jgi:pimeloyl-ACP methyl ester carboxylesterase